MALLQACGGGGGSPDPRPPDPDPEPQPIRCAAPAPAPTHVGLGDPLSAQQWHLQNTGQSGGAAGEDIRAFDGWTRLAQAGCGRGAGVTLAIIDGGVEMTHPDLADNLLAGRSHDYAPLTSDNRTHGTAVAGIIAAVADNGLGGVGIAPEASLVAYGIPFGSSSAGAHVVDALNRDLDQIDVYHNSWSSPDSASLQKATAGFASAIERGLSLGRDGRGAVYVFAAGNGGEGELSTYDGYLNQRGVIVACAVDHQGQRPSWAERGSNLLVCGPSGPADAAPARPSSAITTTAPPSTDRDDFNGSSASAPMVSGVIALMLAANGELSARDVRLILARSARRNATADQEWAAGGTSGGLAFNPQYGFGVVNADAAVELARRWQSVGNESTLIRCDANVGGAGWPIAIPDNEEGGITTQIAIAASDCAIQQIEHVEIRLVVTHDYSGDLSIDLSSPSGTSSLLAQARDCGRRNLNENDCGHYDANWPIATVRHLDEPAVGRWSLRVADRVQNKTGRLESWSIRIWGR